jgi:hypothetical protein
MRSIPFLLMPHERHIRAERASSDSNFYSSHNSMDSLHRIERPWAKRRLKMKSEKTAKERNRQRQKRKESLFHKGYEMREFCDYWVAVILYDPVLGEYYMLKSADSPTWPPLFE